jgi:hypothetical protein
MKDRQTRNAPLLSPVHFSRFIGNSLKLNRLFWTKHSYLQSLCPEMNINCHITYMDMQRNLLMQSVIILKYFAFFQEEHTLLAKYISLMKSNHWQK